MPTHSQKQTRGMSYLTTSVSLYLSIFDIVCFHCVRIHFLVNFSCDLLLCEDNLNKTFEKDDIPVRKFGFHFSCFGVCHIIVWNNWSMSKVFVVCCLTGKEQSAAVQRQLYHGASSVPRRGIRTLSHWFQWVKRITAKLIPKSLKFVFQIESFEI